MKKLLAVVLLWSLFGFAQQQPDAPKSAGQSAPPRFELEHFYMAMMRRAARYDARKVDALSAKQNAYWQKLAEQGDLMLGGPVLVLKNTLAAAMIYRAASADAAATIAQDDPVVKAHWWTAEVHPWMTMKGVLKPLHRYDPATSYYLGFLVQGPKFSPADTPERQKIQEGHMANIKRLGEMGKLVTAGPFEEDIELRGIFVFRTATMEEAEQLTNTDPAVQSGRLKIELYQWKLPSEAFAKR